MKNKMFFAVGLLGAITVALGAFGAHGLSKILSPDEIRIFHTGIEYQFYHVLALLGVVLLRERNDSKLLRSAGRFFIGGIILFSGSVYLLACREMLHLTEAMVKGIGPVTPIGGLMFMVGWVLIAITALKQKTPEVQA